jgi:hypothetical protein
MDSIRYQSLLRQRSQHRRNLAYLQEQAATYGAANVPLKLANDIAAEQAAFEDSEQALGLMEADLDAGDLAATDTYGDGQRWRTAAVMVAQAGHAPAAGVTQERLAVALNWLNMLETRIRDWYGLQLEQLYLDDFFVSDPTDAGFAEALDRVEQQYKAFRQALWDNAHASGICDDLRLLDSRFDSDFRPIIPLGFDSEEIKNRFTTALGGEQAFVHETYQFLDLLLGDIRHMRRAMKHGDQPALQQAQDAAYQRIASLRRQVHDALRQIGDARAALRAALQPIASS